MNLSHRIEKKINILLMDFNVEDRKRIVEALLRKTESFHIIEVEYYEAFLETLKNNKLDIVIADSYLPGLEELQILEEAKKLNPLIPVIIMTIDNSLDKGIRAMKMGASDYIYKSEDYVQKIISATDAVLKSAERQESFKLYQEQLIYATSTYQKEQKSFMDEFAILDLEGNIIDCNESFEHMVGYSRDELRRMTFLELTPCKWHKWVNTKIKQQMEIRGYSDVYEKEYSKKDGTIFPVEIRKVLFTDENSDYKAMLAIVFDITERKHTEDAINESEKIFCDSFESSPVGKSMTGLDGSLYVNKAFCEIIGYSKDELQNIEWKDITFPDDLEISNNAFKNLLEGKIRISKYQKRLIHKNGKIIWTDILTYLHHDQENKPKYFITSISDITERKNSEGELIFRNILLNSQQEASIDGILVLDSNQKILSYNRRLVEIMQIPINQIEESPDESILPYIASLFSNPQQFLSDLKFLNDSNHRFFLEESLLLDGRIIEHYSSPMIGPENKNYGRVWYFRDITERKNAEESLQLSEWKHRIVAENTYDWEFWTDSEDNFIYCSSSCYRITGHNSEKFISDPSLMSRIIHPDDREKYANHRKKTVLGIDPGEIKFRIIHVDGTEHWIGHVCQAILNDSGVSMGRRGSNRDITLQIKADEALKKSEARFRGYFEFSIAGIAITSPYMTFIEVNDHLCNMLGYSRVELLNTKWMDLTYPEDIELDLDHFNRVLNGEQEGYTIDKRFVRKDDKIIWTSLSVKCVRQTNGLVDYFMALLVDITERKKAESALLKTSDELRLIIKNMLNAFITWESVFDNNGNYVSFRFGFFNDAFGRITNVKFDDIYGKDVFEVWPGTEQSWVDIYGKVAITGIPQTFDMYHEPTCSWYHCNAYRPTESTSQICAIFENITAQKQMEAKLAWEQYLMHSLLDNIPDYIYFKDIDSRFLRINKALANNLGIDDPLLAIGKTESDFFNTTNAQEVYNDEQEIICTGVPIIGKAEIEIRVDHSPTWISSTKMPLRDTTGTIIGTFGISRDIWKKRTN
jgi:PAS domain S-box-containing protein